MITIPKPTWSFLNKWFTYDSEDGSASNSVICPSCAPTFERDPSLRPLQDQTPDSNLKCVVCDKPWLPMKNLPEIYEIRDMDDNDYTVFGSVIYDEDNMQIEVKDLTLVSVSTQEVINVPSIHEMPDRFTEKAVTEMYNDLLTEQEEKVEELDI